MNRTSRGGPHGIVVWSALALLTLAPTGLAGQATQPVPQAGPPLR